MVNRDQFCVLFAGTVDNWPFQNLVYHTYLQYTCYICWAWREIDCLLKPHQVYCSLMWTWFTKIIKVMSCIFRRQGGFRYLGNQWHICFGMSCPGEFPPTESANNSKVGCYDNTRRHPTYEVIENSRNKYLVLLHQNYMCFKEVHWCYFKAKLVMERWIRNGSDCSISQNVLLWECNLF